MPPLPNREEVERQLRGLRAHQAPEGLWGRIQDELAVRPRRAVSPLVAAAAILLAVLAGITAGFLRSYGAPSRWAVQPLAGEPAVAGTRLSDASYLHADQWLVTDAASRARLMVGRIGIADIGPNSRVRLERAGLIEHRLTLERGSLHAVIAAPPRLFLVRTPSALATDIGCAYTLDVDSTGSSRLHVTLGWVELREGGGVTVVPAGMAAEVETGRRPGTPYPEDFPEAARRALARIDAGRGSLADFDSVFAALHRPADFITLRQQSAVTLWHLLQRVEPGGRERVYTRLAGLIPPPAGVTREGILALDRPMLERWRRDLSPMWSDEAQWWGTRLVRRLWERTLR